MPSVSTQTNIFNIPSSTFGQSTLKNKNSTLEKNKVPTFGQNSFIFKFEPDTFGQNSFTFKTTPSTFSKLSFTVKTGPPIFGQPSFILKTEPSNQYNNTTNLMTSVSTQTNIFNIPSSTFGKSTLKNKYTIPLKTEAPTFGKSSFTFKTEPFNQNQSAILDNKNTNKYDNTTIKRIKTMNQKYGIDFPMQHPEILKKAQITRQKNNFLKFYYRYKTSIFLKYKLHNILNKIYSITTPIQFNSICNKFISKLKDKIITNIIQNFINNK